MPEAVQSFTLVNVAGGAPLLGHLRQVPELEFFISTPLFLMVRFGEWGQILQEAAPPPDLKYSVAIWHYARGLALTAKGQLDKAEEARRKLNHLADTMPTDRIVGRNSGHDLLEIASTFWLPN
jgi:hypothetical protein